MGNPSRHLRVCAVVCNAWRDRKRRRIPVVCQRVSVGSGGESCRSVLRVTCGRAFFRGVIGVTEGKERNKASVCTVFVRRLSDIIDTVFINVGKKEMRRCTEMLAKKLPYKYLQASYTVEAALLMPVILAVIMALLQICFVYHDRVILREELEYIAFCKTSAEMSSVDFDPKSLEKRFLLSEITGAEVAETKSGIEIVVSMTSRRLVPLYFPDATIEEREYSVKRKKVYAKEKTMISEVLLDTLHALE